MVSDPKQWLVPMKNAGASQFTFHYEALNDDDAVSDLINQIKQNDLKAGLSVKPKTSVDKIAKFGARLDNALIMTVEPGFGGQQFQAVQMEKVRALRAQFPELNIQVDGGITVENVHECAAAGANAIVSGTGIIKRPDQAATITQMRQTVQKATADGRGEDEEAGVVGHVGRVHAFGMCADWGERGLWGVVLSVPWKPL